MRRSALLLMLVVLSGRAGVAHAQSITLSPTILSGHDGILPALRFRADVEKHTLNLDDDRPWERVLELTIDAPFVWNASSNPETIRINADYGYEKSLKKIEGGLEVEEGPAPIDWGFVSMYGGAEVESPQTFDRVVAGLAFGLGYEHRERRIWYVPNSVSLEAAGAFCGSCASDMDGTPLFVNLQGEAGLVAPITVALQLRLRGRAFAILGEPNERELELNTDGVSGSGELAYRRTRASGWWEAFVRWSGGEMPVVKEQDKAWMVGLTYAF
jgi:hypothetical protein